MDYEYHVLDQLPDEALAEEAASVLRDAGIEVRVTSEALHYSAVARGGNEGPKLIVRTEDYDDAWTAYAAWLETQEIGYRAPQTPWRCASCDELQQPRADTCWHCGAAADPSLLKDPFDEAETAEEVQSRAAATADALENIDRRAAARAEDDGNQGIALGRLAFGFLVVIVSVWGLKTLLVWMAER